MSKNRTCKTSMTAPYLRLDFWMNPEHRWWNGAIYSDATRERMEKVIETLRHNERNIAKL